MEVLPLILPWTYRFKKKKTTTPLFPKGQSLNFKDELESSQPLAKHVPSPPPTPTFSKQLTLDLQ